jgi:hypothetical protein
MYTVVFKTKTEDLIIFDVFKKPLLGRQRIIGNVFCRKNDSGEYKAISSIYMASWKHNIKWDGERTSYYIQKNALWICNKMIEECD